MRKYYARTSIIMLMAVLMTVTLSAAVSFAAENAEDKHPADPIGSITADGTTKEYTEYRALKLDLEKLENKDVTVEMLSDWDDSAWKTVTFKVRVR